MLGKRMRKPSLLKQEFDETEKEFTKQRPKLNPPVQSFPTVNHKHPEKEAQKSVAHSPAKSIMKTNANLEINAEA